MFLATYNVYNIFFTLSTAGLPVALSRLIAEADANGLEARKEKTFRTAVGTFAVIGILVQLVLFLIPGVDRLTRVALLMYYTLPASYMAPGLGRSQEDYTVASGVCSILTTVSLVVFCCLAVAFA